MNAKDPDEGLSGRLVALLKKRGARLRLAKEAGVSAGSITAYVKGRLPQADELLRIARALNVSTDYLLTGHDPPCRIAPDELPQPELHFADSLPADVHDRLRRDDYLAVPLVEDRVAAGAPAEVRDAIEGWAIVYRPLLGKRRDLVAIRVRGDSMTPVLPDGCVVIVDRRDKRLVRGAAYVVRVDSAVTVKYLEREPGALVLIPENREHREQRVTIREGEPDPIVGRVVFSWRAWA